MAKRPLSASQVAALKATGNHWIAPSLYLQIRPQGTRSWLFRYERDGRTHWVGLGAAAGIGAVNLSEARREAERLRVAVRDGADPLNEKRAKQVEIKEEVPTFAWCCRQYVAAHEASWTNEKHRFEWGSSLKRYAEPVIGTKPVDEIDVNDVHRVLEPIWIAKPETASRLRGRVEAVLGWATAKGYRSGDNPARWVGGALSHLLPPHGRIQKVTPRKATPYADVPALVSRIRALTSTSAYALLFTLLTAARTIETLGARWNEMDFDTNVWNVPAERMKM